MPTRLPLLLVLASALLMPLAQAQTRNKIATPSVDLTPQDLSDTHRTAPVQAPPPPPLPTAAARDASGQAFGPPPLASEPLPASTIRGAKKPATPPARKASAAR